MTDAEQRPVIDTDVLIVGAGPVGMTLALALADSGAQRVLLIDRRPRGAWADDPRALALSHGTGNCSNAWTYGTLPPARRSTTSTSRSAAASAAR